MVDLSKIKKEQSPEAAKDLHKLIARKLPKYTKALVEYLKNKPLN